MLSIYSGYMPVQAFFAKWDDEGVVDLKDELTELIILTASRTLMGERHSLQMH